MFCYELIWYTDGENNRDIRRTENYSDWKFVWKQMEHTEPFEPRHDKTNKVTVRPAKTQISLGIRPVWSESSLCAQWVAKDPSFFSWGQRRLWSDWADAQADLSFAGRTVTLLVLSCRGSFSILLHIHRLSFKEVHFCNAQYIYHLSLSRENLSSGFLTRVDTNRPAQLQKLAGVLKLWI